MGKKPIEKKVADTILQKSKTVEIGGDTYCVAPPTTATLILVSEKIAMLPQIDKKTEDVNILQWTLHNAKDCTFLGDILAILVLGANGVVEKKQTLKKRFFGLIKEETDFEIDKQQELSKLLLLHKSPRELNELTANLLSGMEIGDFFGLTTSLLEINLMKPTRGVGTIVSGQ